MVETRNQSMTTPIDRLKRKFQNCMNKWLLARWFWNALLNITWKTGISIRICFGFTNLLYVHIDEVSLMILIKRSDLFVNHFLQRTKTIGFEFLLVNCLGWKEAWLKLLHKICINVSMHLERVYSRTFQEKVWLLWVWRWIISHSYQTCAEMWRHLQQRYGEKCSNNL